MPGLTPPLKWHGGKSYLAKRIVAMMPPHIHYVEPYAGGLSVLLAKDPENVSEVVNDIDSWLTSFWSVMMNPEPFETFRRLIEGMPFSEQLFTNAMRHMVKSRPNHLDPQDAAAFFVVCRQSLAGRMKSFAPLSRTRTRRGMNEQASAWINAVDGLPAVHERLRRVVVLNRDAIDVIIKQDGPATLFYLDPPYLHETRAAKQVYSHEMTNEQHEELLWVLSTIQGKFIISGYRSKMYDRWAKTFSWRRADFDLPNNSAFGKEKRRMTECVWTNFPLVNSPPKE